MGGGYEDPPDKGRGEIAVIYFDEEASSVTHLHDGFGR
jgi:hypothetical protein